MAIDFERLASLQGQVIEAVPEEERSRYRYWRGAHLGHVVLNFSKGIKTIGYDPRGGIHFTEEYMYARNVANELARYDTIRRLQYPDHEVTELEHISGFEGIGLQGPSIVLALDEKYNHGIGLQSSNYGMGHGSLLRGSIALDSLDPYSAQVIQSIVEV